MYNQHSAHCQGGPRSGEYDTRQRFLRRAEEAEQINGLGNAPADGRVERGVVVEGEARLNHYTHLYGNPKWACVRNCDRILFYIIFTFITRSEELQLNCLEEDKVKMK